MKINERTGLTYTDKFSQCSKFKHYQMPRIQTFNNYSKHPIIGEFEEKIPIPK